MFPALKVKPHSMPGIDETRQFIPVNFAVLTVSDTRTLEDDRSGALLVERIESAGHIITDRQIVADSVPAIQAQLKQWVVAQPIQAIIATGGTGITGRDVTPEAVEALYDKAIPGFGELFRAISYKIIGTSTIQSRATAGIAGERSCSPCPDQPAPARTPGTIFLFPSSTIAFGPAISSN